MASSSKPSSSSLPTRGRMYDVFLSFRGEDTRYNFVDHLHAALVQKGIISFKDNEVLSGGKHISQSILKAIKESKSAVVVFSENYADSSWCSEELSEIMECHDQMGLKVIPVFYHVDPSDVRKLKGSFATAFQKHELNLNGEKNDVNKWREAVTAATNLCGYHISPVSGGETTTIKKIVQAILGYTQPQGRQNDPIGMESHMIALNPLLSIEATDEVRFIGIYGMGGIGKTTIARALFRKIAYLFEGSSFINDIRENSSTKRDSCDLQKRILTDVLGVQQHFLIQDLEYGANIIEERFCNKKVFLVLDDVDNVKQLEFLAAKHEWFGPGSRIIITTRDEHLLLDTNAKYKPALLRMDQALELFSRHAFKKIGPPDEFKELSNRVIRYTGHLPLALKVLGSFFRGRDVDEWESALNRLSKTPNREILDTLKLSFDGLEEFDKKIFLDIACFFKGREIDYVARVVDSCGFDARIGVTSLIEKSLITVSANRLHMHDLIQQMGWQFVRESAQDSRLRNYEEIHGVIMQKKKLELIEAIVNPREWRWRKLEPEKYEVIVNWWRHTFFLKKACANVFKSMKNLRLLYVKHNFTCRKPTFLPHELRWLCWDEYPFSSLPLANMSKLAGLEMAVSNIKHLWKGQKIMPNLKFLHLINMDRLSRFPDVSRASNIEMLILSQCGNLVEVHESLGVLNRLVHLNINNCSKLKRLPSRFEMESLETLILSYCHALKRLPEFSPCMVKLTNLDVSYCNNLEVLPSSIRNFSNLSILNIGGCRSLNKIPDSICVQDCSNELQIRQAESFIFHDLRNLCSLRKLDLNRIRIRDQDFPKNLYGLSSLKELHLRYNPELMQLPASISHLYSLTHLCLSDCHKLKSLRGLPSGIEVLVASRCISLEVIRDLSEEYELLYRIDLRGCEKLLQDKQNERYLDKMLKQSFLKKWAAIDGCLNMCVPGSNIPSWFKEQQNGSKIALKLPFKWQTEIRGFAICCVFKRSCSWRSPSIVFRFENNGTSVPMFEAKCINASATTDDDEHGTDVRIGYVPLNLFENIRHYDDDCEAEDWSRITEGNLIIEFKNHVERCGALVVYKEDMESTQQIIKPSISSSYYWNWLLGHGSPNIFATCWRLESDGSLYH